MATLATTVKAKLIVEAVKQVFGFEPQLIVNENQAEIKFTKDQEKTITAWIEKQMKKERIPSDVKINLTGIITPILLKKAFPYVAGTFGLGFMFGRKK